MFKQLLELFTKQFIKKVGRPPQTASDFMSIQNQVVNLINKTKGKIPLQKESKTPFQGFTPRVIEGGKPKEGIGKAYDKFYDKTGRMRDRGADIMQKGLAGLEKKTLLKDSPEAIAKIKAENKAAIKRLKEKKKTVEDFSDEGDFDPGGMASGGIAGQLHMNQGGRVSFVKGGKVSSGLANILGV